MSVWKSPVFYFGVALVMLVALALVAPFTVNWSAWKPEMEQYGRNLTGREVSIAGPVDVRLFPWPRLQARDVRLSNADGFGEAPLLSANSVTLRLSLAGLFNASLDVEEIAFEGPQLNLARDATGRMNWTLTPSGEFAGLVSRVKLDRITVKDGSVWFEDRLHGQSTNLTAITANIAADALAGPWRLQGNGQWRDVPVALNFTLGEIESGKPLRVSANVRPTDVELPGLSVDGDWENAHFKGKARITAQELDGEKASLEGALRPLSLQAELDWTRDAISLDKIRIAPADVRDSGTLIEGSAQITLADPPRARVSLDSPRVNLDAILGAQSMARWRRGGVLDLANSAFAGLPEKLVAEFALDVNVLTLGGQSLNGVRLRGVAEKQAIRIHEATSDLPGRSRMRFDGIVFPASTGAELGGTLAFESFDLRDFASWALPKVREDMTAFWQGARGRVKLQTNLNWSAQRLSIQDAAYELDGQGGKVQGTWQFGEVPLIDAQVEMQALDLDSYLGATSRLAPQDLLFGGLAHLPVILDIGQKAEQRVTLQLKTLRLNGASASNLALDYEAGLSGLQLKALDIDALGGAAVKGEGLVTHGADGPLGEFDFVIKAEDITSTLQMAGLSTDARRDRWVGLLGPTDAKLSLGIEPDQGKPRASFSLWTKSGNIAVNAEGKAQRRLGNDEPAIDVKAIATIPELSQLLALYGLETPESAGTATFETVLKGARGEGFDATISARSAKLDANFTGKLQLDQPYLGSAGTLAIKSASLAHVLNIVGAPVAVVEDGALEWQANLSASDGGLAIAHMAGKAAGGDFELNANADAARKWSVDAVIGETHLADILTTVLMPWNGAERATSDSFADFNDDAVKWQAFLRPRVLRTGLGTDLTEAVIAIESLPTSRAVNIKTPGKALNLDVVMVPKGSSFAITGQGALSVDVARVLQASDNTAVAKGQLRLEGNLEATGQSPAAAIASAEGKGVYWVEDLVLTKLTAAGFAKGLESATQQVALAKLFEALTAPPGTTIGTRTGAVVLAGGEAKLEALSMPVDGATLTIAPRADFNVPDVAVEVSVATAQRADLPPVVITYAGTPGQIGTRIANAGLAAKLGYELLAEELAALEQLQQEEAEAIRKQEQQKKDDEERLAAYQAQRGELRNKLRVLRFHQQERIRAKEERDLALADALKTGDAINREELRRAIRLRAIRQQLVEPFVQP